MATLRQVQGGLPGRPTVPSLGRCPAGLRRAGLFGRSSRSEAGGSLNLNFIFKMGRWYPEAAGEFSGGLAPGSLVGSGGALSVDHFCHAAKAY